MAVVYAKEIHVGREGGGEFSGNATATRVWRVKTDSVYDGPGVAINATGVPDYGNPHPDDVNLFVDRIRAVNESFSKYVWIVTVSYKQSVLGKSANPLADPAEITWNTETETRPVFADKDGNAILNSAKDYYEDGVSGEFSQWCVKSKRNVWPVPTWINNYRDAINSDSVYLDGILFTARQLKVSGISIGTTQIRNGVLFRTVETTFKAKDSWAKSILDQGTRCYLEDFGHYAAYDKDGVKITKPILLDGSGGKLSNPTPATAVFNTHYIYPEQPFSFLLY